MNTDIYLFMITVLLFVITTLLLNNYLIDKKSNTLSMTISIIAVMAILIICVLQYLIFLVYDYLSVPCISIFNWNSYMFVVFDV